VKVLSDALTFEFHRFSLETEPVCQRQPFYPLINVLIRKVLVARILLDEGEVEAAEPQNLTVDLEAEHHFHDGALVVE